MTQNIFLDLCQMALLQRNVGNRIVLKIHKGTRTMQKFSKERQQRFLAALANGGDVVAAAAVAGVTKARLDEAQRTDPVFAIQWEKAEVNWADKLEREARRRAVEGIPEPLLSDGKIVRDDDGQPIVLRRYSDELLLAYLKLHRPERFCEYGRVEWPFSRSLKYLIIALVVSFVTWEICDIILLTMQNHVW